MYYFSTWQVFTLISDGIQLTPWLLGEISFLPAIVVAALSQNIFISLITIYKGTPNNGPLDKQLQLSGPSKMTIRKV